MSRTFRSLRRPGDESAGLDAAGWPLRRVLGCQKSTRERVLAIADELGFVPKAQAVSLARKGVGRIGVVAPFTTYPSFWRRLTGIVREFGDSGIEVSIFDQESAALASSPVLAAIPVRGRVDGLIVMGERIDDVIERRLHDRALPVVLVDADSSRFSSVLTDDAAGGALAARHLVELGHQRIGYLVEAQASDYPSQAASRLSGVRRVLERLGLELLVESCAGTTASAHAAALRLLAVAPRPTAIVAHFDDLALGVLQAARDLGLAVPGALSVVGFDDGPVAAAVGLTTVTQPFEESGRLAARMLRARLAEDQPRITATLDLTLAVRATTGAPTQSRTDPRSGATASHRG